LYEHADKDTRDRIAEALEPPVQLRVAGVPAWYGDDDDAWKDFERAMRK